MAEQTSSGEHRKVSLYGGEIDVCDTCVNSLGYNITWEQAHLSVEQEARAAADARFPESPLAPENEQRAEDFYEGYIAGASRPATRKAVTEAKAAAWDEAIAAVAAWWQTPEDERGVIVNPYGTHPADRLLEDIQNGGDHDARSA